MTINTLRAIKKANKFLRLIEDVTNQFQEELNKTEVFSSEEENPFYQLGRLTHEKYGSGCWQGLVLMQFSLNAMLYFQGRLDQENFEQCKEMIRDTFKEIDDLSTTPTMH